MAGMARTILVVDDEPPPLAPLAETLGEAGFRVVTAADGREALVRFRADRPDLVVLDLMLPELSGLEVCRIIRQESSVPVLMLTARTGELDTVVGLEVGADDYVTKPFSLRELQARIRALLRRSEQPSPATAPLIDLGSVQVDLAGHRVLRHGLELPLKPKAFELLAFLVANPGQVFTRDQLLERVWGYDYAGETRTVDVQVHWLRSAIEADSGRPELLRTVRGGGYVLRRPASWRRRRAGDGPERVTLPIFVFLAVVVVALAIALAVALGRGAVLSRLRETLGVGPEADVESAARAVVDGRTAAEWQAQQRARDLAYLADLISVGILRLDEELRVTIANHAAHAFLGRSPGELAGRTPMEAFGDHEAEAILGSARERIAASGEIVLGGPDGRRLVVRARRSPAGGFWVVLEDVSELRRLQRIRTEFIDNLSHELRTPLTNVRLLTETLSREIEAVAVPDGVRDRVAKIDVETGHLVQMVTELLALSRIEAGGSQLYLDVVDLGEVVRASSDRLRVFAERQGVRLGGQGPEGPGGGGGGG